MRLINADELFINLDGMMEVSPTGYIHGETVADMISDAPTIDAVPVRHGKWIIRDNPRTGWYMVTCSECGEDVTSTAPCIGFFPNAKVVWDYCPYCGTRMDEK